MKIDGAIFDLDGTLLDSTWIWDDLSFDFITSHGIKPKDNLRDVVSTMYLDESSRYVVEEYGLSVTPEEVTAYIKEKVTDFYLNKVLPKADAKDFLELLRRRGVKMCIATANERALCVGALKRNDMLRYFDDIFICSEVGLSKTDPKIFELALNSMGTSRENTYIFEDSIHAIRTGAAAGFPLVSVYDKAAAKHAEEIKRLSRYYIRSFGELRLEWGLEG